MGFTQYTPKKVLLVFNGALIKGFASGTFINVEMEVDGFTMDTGANGDTTRVQSLNENGSVTITLQAGSISNRDLSTFERLDRVSQSGKGPLLIKDLNGGTKVAAQEAWIRKLPSVEYSSDASNREWTIDCYKLRVNLEGFSS